MRKLRITDLAADAGGTVLAATVPEHRIDSGGVTVMAPGERSWPDVQHVHDFPEAFLILAGRGAVEVDGARTAIAAGDLLIVEPGEEHHLVSSVERPLVTTWLHLEPAGPADG